MSNNPPTYELPGEQIRNIAERYANLVALYIRLEDETNPSIRRDLASEIVNSALPFYRESLPEGMNPYPRTPVNPGFLEQTCKTILEED